MTISRNLSILAEGVSSAGILSSAYGGALAWQTVQTGNFTAVAGNAYPVNTTSGAITVTLPASPSAGNIVQLTDYAGTWATNNVTVGRNGSNINGAATNSILSTSRESIIFVYVDSTQGWVVSAGFNAQNTISVQYLVVAGGGGGGPSGGGGGAGGMLAGLTFLTSGQTYPITVGAGGVGGVLNTSSGTNGSNSVFNAMTAIGGGRAGAEDSITGPSGAVGGSGGGAGRSTSQQTAGGAVYQQGNAGGNNSISSTYPSGGGGGAGSVGFSPPSSTISGNGGSGAISLITGSPVFYAGGGGGGYISGTTPGTGGAGGGGNGTITLAGGAGTTNTGGVGGGSNQLTGSTGGAGGSGVVILSVPTTFYTGITTGSPTITTSGSNTIIKFTASGSYTA